MSELQDMRTVKVVGDTALWYLQVEMASERERMRAAEAAIARTATSAAEADAERRHAERLAELESRANAKHDVDMSALRSELAQSRSSVLCEPLVLPCPECPKKALRIEKLEAESAEALSRCLSAEQARKHADSECQKLASRL